MDNLIDSLEQLWIAIDTVKLQIAKVHIPPYSWKQKVASSDTTNNKTMCEQIEIDTS